MVGEADKNLSRYMLALSVQDMAFFKLKQGTEADVPLHLQEAEQLLSKVKPDGAINELHLEAVQKRGLALAEESKKQEEEKQAQLNGKVDQDQSTQIPSIVKTVLMGGAFAIGYLATKAIT